MTDTAEVRSMRELAQRLSNIEGKLDKLIRIEERQNTHDDALARAFDRIEKCEDRLRVLEIGQGAGTARTDGNSNLLMLVMSGAMSTLVGVLVWMVKS